MADALVALRVVLEHMPFSEAEFLDGAPLDETAAKLVEMPASDSFEKFEEWKKKQLRSSTPSPCAALCSPSCVFGFHRSR
ncbi:hypothetical protein AHiyo8_00530 [Arthrobacter sp. Hiyo8]|uniref:hypothetical protein n=1 Tax=Arthrobacter sp. Hiyo1 TaxID=1588020 RepID=UPI0006839738|nr:hypothetical protein [Arthrobacter sp. Hiyo1]BAS11750.1 hypothetical protein AHiyo8_00530 [Arthrobacter sp. Hiyo8]